MRRFINCVREAFDASHAWTAPPVRFQSSQLSIVPDAEVTGHRALPCPSHAWSRSQRALLPENSGSIGKTAVAFGFVLRDRDGEASSQTGAVPRHCHVMHGPTGSPTPALPDERLIHAGW